MSYILDALRRSEQERHQDQLKTLAAHDSLLHVKQHSQPLWPYLLVAALLINSLVLIWYVNREPAAASIPQDVLPSETVTDATNASENSQMAPGESLVTAPEQVISREVFNDANRRPEAEREAKVAVVRTPETGHTALTDAVAPQEAPVAVSPSQGFLIEPKVSRPLPLDLSYSEVPKGTVTVAETPLTEKEDLYKDVPYLKEMPGDFQRKVPSMTFNSHIYSPMPEARRVMINNIYLREGQTLENMKVLRIGEYEIVFSIQDEPFKRRVMQDWRAF